jgi:Icc-related predicted phosphoesterase
MPEDIPVYYIPGNHDAEILFRPDDEDKSGMSANHFNLHNKSIELRPGLLLACMGGSTLTYFKANGAIEENAVWSPYPFDTEEKYKKAITSMWEAEVQPWLSKNPNGQVILMTHDGPQGVQTAMHHDQHGEKYGGGVYRCGSPSQTALIRENANNLLFNVHGHNHGGLPLDKLNDVTVINPGSLKNGEFGSLRIG